MSYGLIVELFRNSRSMTGVPTYLVLLLIVSPFEIPVPRRVSEPYWHALKQTAWSLELTGPRCPWITDFRSEVRWVRLRWRESADYPRLADCQRLPKPETIQQLLAFNAAYRNCMEVRRCLRRQEWDLLTDTIEETEWLGCVWQAAREAMAEDQNWFCRRRALYRLQQLIGPEPYSCGCLPPCVPLWRFELALNH
jgi:hypothetical protein